jgi:hypothetical protein
MPRDLQRTFLKSESPAIASSQAFRSAGLWYNPLLRWKHEEEREKLLGEWGKPLLLK